MSEFGLLPIFAAVVNLSLAIFVLTRDPKKRVNRIFFFWGLSLTVWNLGAVALFLSSTAAQALWWARFTHIGVIFIPILVLHLSALLTEQTVGRWLVLGYVAAAFLSIINLTGLFIESVHFVGYAWFASISPFYVLFLLYFSLTAYPALFLVWRAWRKRSGFAARSLSTLLVADVMLLVMGTHDLLPVLGVLKYPFLDLTVYPWGQFAAGIYGLLVGYSVLHDQLLDIRVSLGEHAAFLVRTLFLSAISFCVLVYLCLLMPNNITPLGFSIALLASILSALLTGMLFPRLLGYGTTTLERKILGDRFEYSDQLLSFSQRLIDYQDLPTMLTDTQRQFVEVMGLKSAYLVVIDSLSQEPRYTTGVPSHVLGAFGSGAPLSAVFRSPGSVSLDCRHTPESHAENPLNHNARLSLAALGPEFVLPIAHSQLLGFLLIGPKKSGVLLTRSDLLLCREISSRLAIAVERLLLTERAALLEKFEFLGMMSAGLAHDLRNRLQPIITFLQLHQFGPNTDPEYRALHTLASQNAEAIRAYVHSALFFSDKIKPCIAKISTRELFEGLASLPALRPTRGNCTVRLVDSAQTEIECDRTMIRRIMDNLVLNALDASTDGQEVMVTVTELAETPTRPSWLRIVVSDQGAGIAEEHLSRIFDPYFTTKVLGDSTRGVGLGLNVAQRLVFLHSGTISVASSQGAGTRFTVELPRHHPLKA